MDAIDKKIIRELQQNARLTNQELAERVNLSPSPCLRRVRNLEKSGILHRYVAIIDQEKYGILINAFVNVKLNKPSNDSIKLFEQTIKDFDEVLECYLMSGTNDYLLRVVSKDLQSYEEFIRKKLTIIPCIAQIETNFTFGQIKQNNILPFI